MRLDEVIGRSGIRMIEDRDLDMILSWRNSEHVRSMMVNSAIITKENHIKWYEKIKTNSPPRHIIYCFDGRPVGLISDVPVGDKPDIMDGGYYLGEKGLPLEASFGIIFCSLDYAFEVLNARIIHGEVKKINKASIALDKRCGYRIDEKPDGDVLKEDYYDAIIEKEQWEKYREKIRRII